MSPPSTSTTWSRSRGSWRPRIDTDGRLAITAAIREEHINNPRNWDPRGVGKAARAAVKELVAQRMNELGMAGHTGDYEPLSLEQMAERYRSGVASAA